jgi:Tol biopolymer transport system component
MSTEKQKMSMEETMRQIELEAEAKVIEGYKTGDIQLPKLSADGATLVVEPSKDANTQIDFLKNIMAEGAKKFEAAAGRPMSYSEMRQMFG